MQRVNEQESVIPLPRRTLRRWLFAGGRWRPGQRSEVRVVDLARYRERRRTILPATEVATTRGDSA